VLSNVLFNITHSKKNYALASFEFNNTDGGSCKCTALKVTSVGDGIHPSIDDGSSL